MGVALSQPVKSKWLYRMGSSIFRVGGATMQGWRYNMEDAHVIALDLPRHADTSLFGIFDGHGGATVSSFLSQEFPTFLSRLKDPHDQKELKKMCVELDEYTLRCIPSEDCSGSTGVFVIASRIKNGEYKITVGNIVLGKYRNDQLSMVPLSLDHKPSEPREMERIVKAGGTVQGGRVNGSLALSRAFGDRNYKVPLRSPEKMQVTCIPDFKSMTVVESDFLVLACDGIFENDVFTRQGVIQYLYYKLEESQDLAVNVASLLDECLTRGSNDNMSALLIQFRDGSDYQQQGVYEFVPGPYHEGERHASFQKAYFEDAENAGYTLESARALYDKYHGRSRWVDGVLQAEPGPPGGIPLYVRQAEERQTRLAAIANAELQENIPAPPPLPDSTSKRFRSHASDFVKKVGNIMHLRVPSREGNSGDSMDSKDGNSKSAPPSPRTEDLSEQVNTTSSSNESRSKSDVKRAQRPKASPSLPSASSRKYHTWNAPESASSSTSSVSSPEPASTRPSQDFLSPRSKSRRRGKLTHEDEIHHNSGQDPSAFRIEDSNVSTSTSRSSPGPPLQTNDGHSAAPNSSIDTLSHSSSSSAVSAPEDGVPRSLSSGLTITLSPPELHHSREHQKEVNHHKSHHHHHHHHHRGHRSDRHPEEGFEPAPMIPPSASSPSLTSRHRSNQPHTSSTRSRSKERSLSPRKHTDKTTTRSRSFGEATGPRPTKEED